MSKTILGKNCNYSERKINMMHNKILHHTMIEHNCIIYMLTGQLTVKSTSGHFMNAVKFAAM